MKHDIYVLFECRYSKEVWTKVPQGEKMNRLSTYNFKDLLHYVLDFGELEDIALFSVIVLML